MNNQTRLTARQKKRSMGMLNLARNVYELVLPQAKPHVIYQLDNIEVYLKTTAPAGKNLSLPTTPTPKSMLFLLV